MLARVTGDGTCLTRALVHELVASHELSSLDVGVCVMWSSIWFLSNAVCRPYFPRGTSHGPVFVGTGVPPVSFTTVSVGPPALSQVPRSQVSRRPVVALCPRHGHQPCALPGGLLCG